MNKRIWAAALAAAVTFTSAAILPYNDRQVVMGAAQAAGSEVEDKSTDGRTTATGFTFTVSGKEATITGYSGSVKDLAIPTKITVTQENSTGDRKSVV